MAARGEDMGLTGGRLLARCLSGEGVRHVFGLPGEQLMHALDGLYHEKDIRFVTTRHEQGTTYMADGYARSSGRPGVAMVVPGVGVYNAAAGLATAWACSSQVLLLAGQVNRDGIGAGRTLLHEIHDQLEVVRPITKWRERVLEAGAIPRAVQESFRQLRSGRPRPAYIEIPPEALAEECDVEPGPPLPAELQAPDPAAIRRAAELLARAERPLIFAGGGVVLADASPELTALAHGLQAAVITTREGKGAIDERDPLSVGTMWTNPRLRPFIGQADVVLAVGTRLSGSGVLESQALIRMDADAAELDRPLKSRVGIACDARLGLAALCAELGGRAPGRPSRTGELAAVRADVEARQRALGPAAALAESLRRALPDDGILAAGTTTVGYMCHMHFPAYRPRTYLASSYMGTLGFAFPCALGAKVAHPDRAVVCAIGDGGFLFTASELATAVQHGIAVVTVVFNDGAYGNSNRDQRERFGGREIGTLLENPDFARLAQSFGADGLRLRDASQLESALREAIEGRRPAVIECPIPRLPSAFV
jgi:acetolactate synthase-1/2/3 large subunit